MTIGDPDNEWQLRRCSVLFIKDWQFSITSDLRGDLVESVFHNMVKSILPANGNRLTTAVLSERRRLSLLQFAHKVENDMYNRSDSKEEYLNLISRKIASIRREFEERRLLRKIDNLASNVHKQTGNDSIATNLSGLRRQHQDNHHLSTWIQALSVEHRLQIVKRILQVICSLEPRAGYDLRFLRLINFVQKIEKDIFKVARTKEEYYQLITDRVHKILIELNHKRLRKQERQQTDQISDSTGNSRHMTNSHYQLMGENYASPSIKVHMNLIRKVFELPMQINQ